MSDIEKKNRFDILMDLANDQRPKFDPETFSFSVPRDYIEDVLKHADDLKPILKWLEAKKLEENDSNNPTL